MNWSSWTWKGLIVFALGVALAALALFLIALPEVVDVTPLDSDADVIGLPAAPNDIVPSDIACKAEKVEKFLNLSAGGGYWGYTAQHEEDGSRVTLRWTDAPGLDQSFSITLNGEGPATPDADQQSKECLRRRAVLAEDSLE